jgi:uncharacterized protein YecT (DUF1311 family)
MAVSPDIKGSRSPEAEMHKNRIPLSLVCIIGLSACAASAGLESTVGDFTPNLSWELTFTPSEYPADTSTPTLQGNPWVTRDFETLDCWLTAQSQFDLNQCSGKQEALSYQYMLNTLDALKQLLNTERQNRLLEVQTKWEDFRKSDCGFYRGLYHDASMAPMVYGECLNGHNIERINQLNEYLCDYYGKTDYCIIFQ